MCRFAISLRPIASRKALTAMSTAPETSKPIAANLVWSVLTVLAACVVALAFRTRNCFVDDAFIDFQYLENLWAGKGFVFHPGTVPVEGVTNIGWLLVLAPLSSVADPAAVAKLLGLALVLSTLILTASLGRYLAANVEPAEESLGLVLVPLLVLAASFDFVYFSLAGMETALLAAILMLGACLAAERPHSAVLPALGAFAFLVHPEAVVVYPLYWLLRWSRKETDRRKLVVGAVIFAALLGGITALRYWYFHALVPNTFYSKPSDLRLALENGYNFLMGQNTNVAFPITGWLAIPVLGLGYVRLRRRAPRRPTCWRPSPAWDWPSPSTVRPTGPTWPAISPPICRRPWFCFGREWAKRCGSCGARACGREPGSRWPRWPDSCWC